jgi:hypothetical protein
MCVCVCALSDPISMKLVMDVIPCTVYFNLKQLLVKTWRMHDGPHAAKRTCD